ncbi:MULTISPECIES: SusC/RagA family TonB-linked outer membrane protein [Bacteroides]|jgi:TonB-linked SusC/RagA family outer membrane protein|uniref:SusC/RagA family TonB-linked outer membrane protein n=2 Tax=Bacteroides TaxID=816 RepID=A0A1C7H2K8_9BACE|nr:MULTISPECIES: TonB-dependent receptor [Bacteroides]ANU58789.1 SusC/RagA family TonB-linked outer membrane protein [Bacteroides caecimuris]NDO55967.1 TonB-dependent receptor [Bacteroides acidifaciens]NDO60973.1 TonB-dependent receptor [Bacteroides caecimuris]OXE62688.1 SusC/RagA family TonB-linked outer membrane protein [Bacteroides caecimuris]QQR16287.1 TonB-dependent receptor [Bacteroides caecimuris]
MRKFILWFVFLAVLTAQSLHAQDFLVKGKVISHEDNEPLIGVSVLQEGSTNGIVTDIYGNYTLEIKGTAKATLIFSYIGMQSQKHEVNARTGTLNVVLESDAELIDEVVVVAYGTRKKGTIAGSVATVKAEKMENVPAAGFDQSLQGQTPGLQVISNSGEPSKAAVFQIRGTNSINSGTSPLFILDGVPISSSDFNTISPGDIESISVLKDASSTSIYGARAANGVVVITTKRGLSIDKAKVTLRAQYGISQLASDDKWMLMDTPERIRFEQEIGIDKGKDYELLSRTNVNWLNEVFNDSAPLQSYELSVNRATDRLNYYVSGGFFDQEGIAQSSNFRRFNMRANAEVKASNWLKVGTSTMTTYEEVQQAEEGAMALYTPIAGSRFMLPYWNPYNEDGSLASENNGTWTGTGQNPIEWMANNPVQYKKYKLLSTVFADITPVKNLTIHTQFGVDYTHSTAFMQSFPSYIINNESGSAGRSSSDILSLSETTTANYRWALNDNHSFNFMLGQEAVNYQSTGFQAIAVGQAHDMLTTLSSGTRATSWVDNNSSYYYLSFFFRGEYNFKDLYYAEAAVRTDASSRFGKQNRWGGFWSLGFMWNIKNEAFLKDVKWLSGAQIALSTGTSGNSEIPNYDHLALVSGGPNYLGQAGIYPMQSGNSTLGWEQTWTNNVGLRLSFINRIGLDVDFYHKKTTNILMLVPQSYALTGEKNRWENIGAMVNRGVEISANADIIRTKDFTWNVSANVSYNKNKLVELYNGVTEYVQSTTGLKFVVGHPVHEFFLNRYAGVNPANGDALWYTKDGELTTEFREEDKVMTGKTFDSPWAGGFGTSLAWKGLSLSAQFSWMANRWVMNNDRFFEESNGLYSSYNQSKRLLYDRWKKPGDVTDIPRYGVVAQLDDRFLENASFLRLKNLTLAYVLPQAWFKKSNFFSSARIYLQGQNLLTFTGFKGLDPEVASNIYRAQYPASRQFTLGVEVSF